MPDNKDAPSTPSYIQSLLIPQNGNKVRTRRVWSIPLEQVWLPFFTATNATGDTRLSSDVLGAPIRLAYNKDGSVKFSNAGRPVTRVAKDLSDTIRLVRENFMANLVNHTEQVMAELPDKYEHQLRLAEKAGKPILTADKRELDKALARATAEAMPQPEPQPKVPEKVPAGVTS